MSSIVRTLWLMPLAFTLLLQACERNDPAIWRRVQGQWTYDGAVFDAADANTLKPLDGRFARDAVQGYYRGSAVRGSHGPSFEVLGEHEARDRQAVYWADTYRRGQEYYAIRHVRVDVIEAADPARYQVLRYGYGRDGTHAYLEGKRLPQVRDAATFDVLTRRLSRDARRAYFEDEEIPNSDGATFEIIDAQDDAWVRDSRHAWYVRWGEPAPGQPPQRQVRLLAQAQPSALRPLGRDYASDGQRIWWRGRPVEGADAGSFTVIESVASSADPSADARDAKGVFEQGRRVVAGRAG